MTVPSSRRSWPGGGLGGCGKLGGVAGGIAGATERVCDDGPAGGTGGAATTEASGAGTGSTARGTSPGGGVGDGGVALPCPADGASGWVACRYPGGADVKDGGGDAWLTRSGGASEADEGMLGTAVGLDRLVVPAIGSRSVSARLSANSDRYSRWRKPVETHRTHGDGASV